MAYAPERREAVLKKLLPPNAVSIAELSRTESISEQTQGDTRQVRFRRFLKTSDSYIGFSPSSELS